MILWICLWCEFLKDEEIDVAVFSLALWGTNYKDYLVEAHRVLGYGLIFIAEPSKKYNGEDGQEELKTKQDLN